MCSLVVGVVYGTVIIDHAEKAELRQLYALYAARVAYREERWGREGDGKKRSLFQGFAYSRRDVDEEGEVDIAGATSVTSVNNEHLRVTSFH